MVLCPITTIVYGILQKAQRETCAMEEAMINGMYERKHKPLPSSERRFLKRLFQERPYVELHVNVCLVAKFLRLPGSTISRCLVRLLSCDELSSSTVYELVAVAIGIVRAIQQNDMQRASGAGTSTLSMVKSVRPTNTTSAIEYLTLSAVCAPSELGTVLFKLPPRMGDIVEEVQRRCYTLLHLVASNRDLLCDAALDRFASADASAAAGPSETKERDRHDGEEEDFAKMIRKQNVEDIRTALFDDATKKRHDYIGLIKSLSDETKRLFQETRGDDSITVDYLLETYEVFL